MPKLPQTDGKKLLKFLEYQGFEVIRIRGSHHFIENRHTNKRTCIPIHGKETLRPGLLLGILNDIDMSKDEFCKKLSA